MLTLWNLDVSQEMILSSDGIDFYAEFMEEWVDLIYFTKLIQLDLAIKLKRVQKELLSKV